MYHTNQYDETVYYVKNHCNFWLFLKQDFDYKHNVDAEGKTTYAHVKE